MDSLKMLAEGGLAGGGAGEEGGYCLSFSTFGAMEWAPVMFMTIVQTSGLLTCIRSNERRYF